MSVIVQPVDEFQVFGSPYDQTSAYWGLESQKIWIKKQSAPSWLSTLTSAEAEMLSYRGFLNTANSMVKGQHLCDNLQISGVVSDLRNIPFLSFKPSTAKPSVIIPYVTLSGTSYPAAYMLSLGDVNRYKYTTSGPRAFEAVIASYSNGTIAMFEWQIDGRGYWNSNYSMTVYVRKAIYSPTIDNYIWYALSMECYAICYQPFTEQVIDNIILPWISSNCVNYPTSQMTYWGPGYRSPKSVNPSSKDIYLQNYMKKFGDWTTALETYTRVPSYNFGDCHYQAVEKIDVLNNNGIAYLKDIREILDATKDYLKLLKGDASPQALASAFLGWKYGFSSTYRDTLTNFQALKKSYGKTISGVSATAYDTYRGYPLKVTSTIKYSPSPGIYKSIYNTLMSLDLFPTAGNVWDFIPFSFVVNWIVNIDDCLNRIDLLDRISYFDINAVFDTLTLTGSVPASTFGMGLSGNIVFKRYTRRVSRDAFFPLISPTVNPKLSSHWLELAALVVQKLG